MTIAAFVRLSEPLPANHLGQLRRLVMRDYTGSLSETMWAYVPELQQLFVTNAEGMLLLLLLSRQSYLHLPSLQYRLRWFIFDAPLLTAVDVSLLPAGLQHLTLSEAEVVGKCKGLSITIFRRVSQRLLQTHNKKSCHTLFFSLFTLLWFL